MAEEIKCCTQNRELAWLTFNGRVLDEAADPTVPLLERLGFLSIFTKNLDEFFMVRVSRLCHMVTKGSKKTDPLTGMTANTQLKRIDSAVRKQYQKFSSLFFALQSDLRQFDVCDRSDESLQSQEELFVSEHFQSQILPYLSPQIIDRCHPFPHLQNKVTYILADLFRDGKLLFGLVPLPQSLTEIVILPGKPLQFLRTERIVFHRIAQLFPDCQIANVNLICATRDAGIRGTNLDLDDCSDDRQWIKCRLNQQRSNGPIVRLETSLPLSQRQEELLLHNCKVKPWQIYQSPAPFQMNYVGALKEHLSPSMCQSLLYPTYTPRNKLAETRDLLNLVRRRDILLSLPYESMDPFLELIRQAGTDSEVCSIKITIYRLGENAKLVDYLCTAAENGKDVVVIIELRARFDEENNMKWAERLKQAGCRVLYGPEVYKVHGKICLITSCKDSGTQYITQIGTGNYNEQTATMYTDLSLITSDFAIGRDAARLFRGLLVGKLEQSYHHLLVSPMNLRQSLLSMIQQEREKGGEGYLLIKCNSLTDESLIRSLIDASQAGVQIELIVRSACGILPGVCGWTDNITVTSIVGRFLEHARVYVFGKGADQKIYLGSADWMTRNMERRVEVMVPVYDDLLKSEIRQYLETQLHDNVKARSLQNDGAYHEKPSTGNPVCAQERFMDLTSVRDSHTMFVSTTKNPYGNHFLRHSSAVIMKPNEKTPPKQSKLFDYFPGND